MSRVHGKPTERVETITKEPESLEELRRMSSEERRALLVKLTEEGRMPTLHAVAEGVEQ